MRNSPRSLKRLTPIQLLIVGGLILFGLLYETYVQSQPDQAAPSPSAPSPAVVLSPTSAGAGTPTGAGSPSPSPSPSSNPAGSTPARTQTTTQGKTPTVTNSSPSASEFGNFDFFVLSLSWSPDYCASDGQNDVQQCSIGKKLGFVLHGLWPQYNQGYPSSCSTEKLPASVKAQFPGLYPNDSLADHEWEKHGTCSGLPPARYLAYSKQIKESVAIPDDYRAPQSPFRTNVTDLVQQFIQANPGFNSKTFAVNCSSNGRYLKELYVCFSKDGKPQACSAEVLKDAAKTCQNVDFLVRNTR